jgi:hypothetical protein
MRDATHSISKTPGRGMPAPRALDSRADRLVVAVEQIRPRRFLGEHERLEEPGRVREVPLGGRGVGERLDGGVSVAERRCEVERQATRRREPFGERGAGR